MTLVQPKSKLQRWLLDTLLLGLGGAGAGFLALFIANILSRTNRVAADGVPTSVFVALGIVSVTLFFLFRWRYRGCGTALLVSGGWVLAYFVVNIIAQVTATTSGMSLVTYVLLWLGVGAALALLVNAAGKTKLAVGAAGALGAGAYVASRQGSAVLKTSGYGRIPPSSVILLTQHVRTANDAVAQLPANAPAAIRKIAVGVVLDHVIRDWWKNENREGLTPTDVADLGAFVQLAWSAARGAGSLPEAEAVTRAVLTALMDDWFNSWNADGSEGAPRWQYQ